MNDAQHYEHSQSNARRRTGRVAALVAAILLLLAAAGIGVWWFFGSQQPAEIGNEPGATLISGEGMTDEELQAEVDRLTRESMMDISVASQPELDGETVRINLINSESNKYAQRFTIVQDGQQLYESGAIAPGQQLEYCDVPGLQPGTATVTVQAVSENNQGTYGNATAIDVTIVEKAS